MRHDTRTVFCALLFAMTTFETNVVADDETKPEAAPAKPAMSTKARASTKSATKAAAKPALPAGQISAARQADLAATLAKRRAAAKLKRARASATNAAEIAAAQAEYEREVKLAPYRAAAANEMLRQQSQMNSLQLQQQQSALNNQQAVINRQRQILLHQLNGGTILYGPNGPMLPGELPVAAPNPALPTLPSMGP